MEERNIGEVIQQMLDKVPEQDPLRNSINNVLNSIRYTAPEALSERWYDLMVALQHRFGDIPPDSGWEGEVVDIITMRKE